MNDKTTPDLATLPCPFCGTSGAVHVSRPDTRQLGENQSSIMCQLAGCAARTGWFDVSIDALDAWNRRPLVSKTKNQEGNLPATPATDNEMSFGKMKYTVKPSVNFESGEIRLETLLNDCAEKLSVQLVQTKDRIVRHGLIALGWTPPEARATTDPVADGFDKWWNGGDYCSQCSEREKSISHGTWYAATASQADQLNARDSEIAALREENERLREALQTLARLGNGGQWGNSDGNIIAQNALNNQKPLP